MELRLSFAVEIAYLAGAVTLEYFRRRNLSVERKADHSPVTIADRAAEELLRSRIAERYPHDGIVGEEFGTETGTSDYQWVLDPIDGTKSFVHGIPLYTTLVAVLRAETPCLGVIHAPAMFETVFAAKDGGCWHATKKGADPESARVSNVPRLNEGLLLTSEVGTFTTGRERNAIEVYHRLERASQLTRTWGDGYGYLMVATGRAEVMIDPKINVWDGAALLPVIEEAGGRFTDWQGRPSVYSGDSIGSNGLVADEVLGVTRGW
ncbi:MAG: histidinol-phosphatase [Planctomycetes bacterium]|nr:histidinol-phosphatase [Planctomycetota bacterium]